MSTYVKLKKCSHQQNNWKIGRIFNAIQPILRAHLLKALRRVCGAARDALRCDAACRGKESREDRSTPVCSTATLACVAKADFQFSADARLSLSFVVESHLECDSDARTILMPSMVRTPTSASTLPPMTQRPFFTMLNRNMNGGGGA
jgi:hypothetical protein